MHARPKRPLWSLFGAGWRHQPGAVGSRLVILTVLAVVLATSTLAEAKSHTAKKKATAERRGTHARTHQPHATGKKAASASSKSTKKKTSKKSTKSKSKPAAPAPARPPDPNKVVFSTPDGVELAASWLPVEGAPDAPAVLLIHSFSRDRREWEPFIPAFRERGLAVLAIDLRGHGESTKKRAGRIQVTPSLLRDPQAFPRDVEAACQWLLGRTKKVGVVGWQVGGNLSVLATANGWAQAGVAISPSSTNLTDLAGGRATQPRSTLLIASIGDPGREPSARALEAGGLGPKKLIVYPGAEHARALVETHKDALEETVAWMAQQLGAVPPPAPPVPLLKVPSVSTSPVLLPAATPVPTPHPEP